MVSAARVDGGPQILSAGVRKTILSIKEIVGNHSDAEIYATLKETNMDPNETAQKLLNQDPFHEVKRKRDKKKEITGHKDFAEPRKHADYKVFTEPRKHAENKDFADPRKQTENRDSADPRKHIENKDSADPRKHTENARQGIRSYAFSGRNNRRGGYSRNSFPGMIKEFRVKNDKRINQGTNGEIKSVLQPLASSSKEQQTSNVPENGSMGTSSVQKPSGDRPSSQVMNGPTDSHFRHARDAKSTGSDMKESTEERRTTVPTTALRTQTGKPNDSQAHSTTPGSSNSVVGVYSSSSDPVHVPSLDSRSSASVGAIRREVGVVGVRRQYAENSVKHSSVPGSSFSNSLPGRDNPSSEPFRHFTAISKSDQPSQTTSPESVISNISVSRSFSSNQYGSRPHQPPVGHPKAVQNKEWKPKSSQKSNLANPGVIGAPAKSVSPPAVNPADNIEEFKSESANLQDKLVRVNIHENQNVIIAEHIRVPETDRCRLTFGSFGTEFDASRNMSGFQAVGTAEESGGEPSASLTTSAPDSSSDDNSGSKQDELLDDQVRNSCSGSPASGAAVDHQFSDKRESSSLQNLDNYSDVGMVRDSTSSYPPSESQQLHDTPELPNFSAYDPQTGYDMPYFRPAMDESGRGPGIPFHHEALTSHTANSIPASTIAMMQQQQQPPVAQMYPQVHLSHVANLMPYRQFLSPLYVPPMPMSGYSSNPAYPHPSNGNSYVLMPGGNSHLNANGLKYGIQQFKPVPTGSPTGFGNYTSPAGYAINAPGVGSSTGLDDSSRLKYKDGNIYVPNPQGETSEIWIQNPREIQGMQSPYYMAGQTPHGAYLPSHNGHASFNPAAAQSSHMQFPGMYHPQQPAALATPHHLGPAIGGNVGVAPAAPGAQVGAYQQPPLGHLNWTTNF